MGQKLRKRSSCRTEATILENRLPFGHPWSGEMATRDSPRQESFELRHRRKALKQNHEDKNRRGAENREFAGILGKLCASSANSASLRLALRVDVSRDRRHKLRGAAGSIGQDGTRKQSGRAVGKPTLWPLAAVFVWSLGPKRAIFFIETTAPERVKKFQPGWNWKKLVTVSAALPPINQESCRHQPQE